MTMFIRVTNARTGASFLLNAAAVEQFHPGKPKGAPDGTNCTAWFSRAEEQAFECLRETVEEVAAMIAADHGSRFG